ncbi:MAG: hypothetical protein H7A22_06145 [Spirochaetales bacterium]|nr:hypothetical protein [Spirochaetales bacterium]
MSKHETPLIRAYWERIGGTLIEEFLAVETSPTAGRRLLDGLIIIGGEKRIALNDEISIQDQDVIVLQAKASRLGMYLMGQALFSKQLVERLGARRTICRSVQPGRQCATTDAGSV